MLTFILFKCTRELTKESISGRVNEKVCSTKAKYYEFMKIIDLLTNTYKISADKALSLILYIAKKKHITFILRSYYTNSWIFLKF